MIMKNWCIIDFEARRSFWTTYKRGTWDKGGLGKVIFVYSMARYIAAFVWGAYKLSEWLVNKELEAAEKIEKFLWSRKRVEVVEEESVVETTTE